ncbi:hypothetical protein VP01_4075g2 [Puccinia sorghi]|uniref:Integrase catalytic domain-containing protein n=1 Tax=Puccinia sorghi TaxID=27349 RepID=A0A0L6URG2_9BASI|nr:hypothetical protein VP01_4075g2 [Puccinia sorghi]
MTSAELLHKSLGHVSYSRLRKNLGIPLKIEKTCESCAISKITRGSFKSKHRRASKVFEEVHLDLMGPIWPPSRNGHRYILTFLDSRSRFCSAIPLKHKSNVFQQLTYMIDIEAKRQNGLAERFNRTIIESLRSILHDSGMNSRLWNELARVSSLTINQIPSHKSKKSPFEVFKNQILPLSYFHPIGNRVSYLILPEHPHSKIKPKGSLGHLIGYKDELQSLHILAEDGKIIETKHIDFLRKMLKAYPKKLKRILMKSKINLMELAKKKLPQLKPRKILKKILMKTTTRWLSHILQEWHEIQQQRKMDNCCR